MNGLRRRSFSRHYLVPFLGLIMILTLTPMRSEAGFTTTGNMVTPRTLQTATLLQNGKLLIVGGVNSTSSILNSAELYDPVTGLFINTGSLSTPRRHHTASLLTNGKVLVTGGDNSDTGALAGAELYNPQTGAFTPTGNMGAARANQTATGLQDGKVLIAGGSDGNNSLDSAELYDPAKGTFTPAGIMLSARRNHTATLLKNGNILLAGGLYVSTFSYYFASSTWSAEIYDPVQGSFTQTGHMLTQRQNHTATLLNNGTLLITGGNIESSGMCIGCGPISNSELFDPTAGSFTATGSMSVERTGHAASNLSNGNILITGGASTFLCTKGSGAYGELYDPTSGTFTVNYPLPLEAGVPATVMTEGRVIVNGTSGATWLYRYAEPTLLTIGTDGGLAEISYTPTDIRQSCFTTYMNPLSYLPGTAVTLTAPGYAGNGNRFLRWLGCDNYPTDGDSQCDITMTANRTAVAVYAPLVTVTVTTSTPGLKLWVDGSIDLPMPQTFTWLSGTAHYIDAPSPQPLDSGLSYLFTSWSDGGGQGHTVIADSSMTLTASFAATLLPARAGGYYYVTIFDACYLSYMYSHGSIIETQAITFVGDLTLNSGIDLTINGGYDNAYSPSPTGMTSLKGKLIVENGSLIVNRLAVR